MKPAVTTQTASFARRQFHLAPRQPCADRRIVGRPPKLALKVMTPESTSIRNPDQALVDLAIESWRFIRAFQRAIKQLDAGEPDRFVSQLRYFEKRVEESLESRGLKLISLAGQPYDPGMAASPLNIADFGPEEMLVVDQMVEPIVTGPGGLLKQGTVLLKRKSS